MLAMQATEGAGGGDAGGAPVARTHATPVDEEGRCVASGEIGGVCSGWEELAAGAGAEAEGIRAEAQADDDNPQSSLTFKNNKHRSALRGISGSACPQPEPNATELPSCAPISARDAQRRRRRRWWRGDEGAHRPGPEGQVLRHVLWHGV